MIFVALWLTFPLISALSMVPLTWRRRRSTGQVARWFFFVSAGLEVAALALVPEARGVLVALSAGAFAVAGLAVTAPAHRGTMLTPEPRQRVLGLTLVAATIALWGTVLRAFGLFPDALANSSRDDLTVLLLLLVIPLAALAAWHCDAFVQHAKMRWLFGGAAFVSFRVLATSWPVTAWVPASCGALFLVAAILPTSVLSPRPSTA